MGSRGRENGEQKDGFMGEKGGKDEKSGRVKDEGGD